MQPKSKNINFVVGIVIVVVGLFIIVIFSAKTSTTNTSSSTASTSGSGSSPAPTGITADLSAVSQSTLDTIGVGSAQGAPQPIKAPALVTNAKPEVLYEGAEYCPYCATERWAMTVALDKFGTFSKLGVTHSSATDVYPNTQTLSYYGSTYTSSYLSFVPIEIYTNIPNADGYTTLQTPTAAENTIVTTYDATPYLPSASAGSIPFIDFGGKYLIAGATYAPAVLQGKSAVQIASALNDPTSKVAQGVDGAANTIIAALCKLTDNQPTTTCDSVMQKIEAQL